PGARPSGSPSNGEPRASKSPSACPVPAPAVRLPGEEHPMEPDQQPGAEMNELLGSAVAAHGGLDRWNQVRSITVDAAITGALWALKSKADALNDVRFEVDTTRERLRVVLQRRDGALTDARDDPERSFDGHQLQTSWDDIHLAY